MSFTSYKWGVSKPYRSLWPILGFSSLRTDYARIVQVNDFFIRIVHRIFKRVRSFRNFINFSHIVIKIYSVVFYDRPIFSLELFFWVKHLKDFLLDKSSKLKSKNTKRYKRFRYKKIIFKRPLKKKIRSRLSSLKIYRKDLAVLKKLRKFSKIKYRKALKRHTNSNLFSRKGLIKNFYIMKNKYNLIRFSRSGVIFFMRRCQEFIRRKRYKISSSSNLPKIRINLFSLRFRKFTAYQILKDIKILPNRFFHLRRRKKKNFKRYNYFRKVIKKRSRHLRISVVYRRKKLLKRKPRVKSNTLSMITRLNYKLNVINLIFFFKRVKRFIQRKRIIFFLELLNTSFKIIKVNVIFFARLINLSSGTIYLYLNHFTKKIARRREVNPKSLLKTLIRDLKKNKKTLRIKGAILKARGRFTRRDRAPKVKMRFGSVSVSTLKTRISYAQKDFIFRFGKASIKMIISYAR